MRAAARRARQRQSLRDAVAKEFRKQISELRLKWQNTLSALHAEQDRRQIAVREHKALADEVEKYRSQDRLELQQLELRRSGDFAAAKAAHKEALGQLAEKHRLELARLQHKSNDERATLNLALTRLQAKYEADLGAAKAEIARLSAEATRLRAHRDRLGELSLRYNAERNAARDQILALQARKSSATVANCGPVLSFGGN